MTDEVKAANLFRAERELRDFGHSMKAVIALADQIEEVGNLQAFAIKAQANLEALRKAEEDQRGMTDAIKAENEALKVKVAENKRRLSELSNEARDAEACRDEAMQLAQAARADLDAATADYAALDALRKDAARDRDEALRASTEAKAVHADLTAKIVAMKAQIAGLDAA